MAHDNRQVTAWLFHSFLILLIWIPLPRASNRPEAWGLMEILTFVLLQAWLWQQLRHRRPIPAAVRTARPALWLWGLWLTYGLIQLIPLSPDLLALISPKAAELQHLPPLPPERWAPLSLSPHATSVQWLKGLCYAALFFLTLVLVDSQKRLRQLATTLVFSAVLQALYGTAMTLSGLEYGFLVKKTAYIGTATGTFVNRNHFANYLVMAAAVAVGAILAQLEETTPARSARARWRNLLNWLMSGKMWIRLALLGIAVGIVASRSRMGNAAFFFSLHLAGLLAWLNWPSRTRPAILALLVSMVVLDVFIIGSLVGLERVAQRLEHTTPETEGRDEIARDTFHYWQDFPLFGSGPGTYATTLPAYKQGDVKGFYDHAHNDYLEFAAESGLIGLGLLCLLVLLSLHRSWSALRHRHNPWKRAMALASLTATLAMGLHASVDFNLQIPANAVLFVVLLATAWISATPSTASPLAPSHGPSALTVSLILLITLEILAFKQAAADFLSNENRIYLATWRTRRTVAPEEWQRSHTLQQWAVTLDPGNPLALATLAKINFWHRILAPRNRTSTTEQKTSNLLLRAVTRQPADARLWLAIALVRHQRHDTLFHTALHHSARLAPWESAPQRALLKLLVYTWPWLDQADRRLLSRTLERNRRLQPGLTEKILARSPHRREICATLLSISCQNTGKPSKPKPTFNNRTE